MNGCGLQEEAVTGSSRIQRTSPDQEMWCDMVGRAGGVRLVAFGVLVSPMEIKRAAEPREFCGNQRNCKKLCSCSCFINELLCYSLERGSQ